MPTEVDLHKVQKEKVEKEPVNLGAISNLTYLDAISTMESLMNDDLQEMQEKNQKIKTLRALMQEVRVALTSEEAKETGMVDFSNNKKVVELIDFARKEGIVIPDGYAWSKDQASAINENIKNTLDTMVQSTEHRMLRWKKRSDERSLLWDMCSGDEKVRSDTMKRMAQMISR